MYAFGTVWYELLTGEWPWKQQPPESIIWQVGCGMKPTLANLAASKEVKDVLMQCWVHSPDTRPGFPDIAQTLDRWCLKYYFLGILFLTNIILQVTKEKARPVPLAPDTAVPVRRVSVLVTVCSCELWRSSWSLFNHEYY